MDLTLEDPFLVEEWEVGPEFGKQKNYQLPQPNRESHSSDMVIVEPSSEHEMDSLQFRHIQPVQKKLLNINPNVSDTKGAKSSRIKQELASYQEAPGNPDNESIEERQKRLKKNGQCSIKSELFNEEFKAGIGYGPQSESNDSSLKSSISDSSMKELSQQKMTFAQLMK